MKSRKKNDDDNGKSWVISWPRKKKNSNGILGMQFEKVFYFIESENIKENVLNHWFASIIEFEI